MGVDHKVIAEAERVNARQAAIDRQRAAGKCQRAATRNRCHGTDGGGARRQIQSAVAAEIHAGIEGRVGRVGRDSADVGQCRVHCAIQGFYTRTVQLQLRQRAVRDGGWSGSD